MLLRYINLYKIQNCPFDTTYKMLYKTYTKLLYSFFTHPLTNSYVIYGWYLSWSSISLVWDSTRAVCILFNMARTGLFFWFFRAITALDKPESELCTVERRILPFPEVCFSLTNAQWIIKTWKNKLDQTCIICTNKVYVISYHVIFDLLSFVEFFVEKKNSAQCLLKVI